MQRRLKLGAGSSTTGRRGTRRRRRLRRPPMELVALLPGPVEDLARRAEGLGWSARADDGRLVLAHASLPGGRATVETVLRDLESALAGRQLTPLESQRVAGALDGVLLSATLGGDRLADATACVRALYGLCPELLGVDDPGGLDTWSARFVQAVAAGERGLRLLDLYRVDMVVHEHEVWAHTHGLERLGLADLEAFGSLDVDEHEHVVAFLHELVCAAAEYAFHFASPDPSEAALLHPDLSPIAWIPWRDYLADAGVAPDALGGLRDREPPHSGERAVLGDGDGRVQTRPRGMLRDAVGWAAAEPTLAADQAQAARTIDAAEAALDVAGRSLWVAGPEAGGTVVARSPDAFTVERDDGAGPATIRRADVHDWCVQTPSGFGAGPWQTHALGVLEQLAEGTGDRFDDEGRLLCSGCGAALGPGHRCQG